MTNPHEAVLFADDPAPSDPPPPPWRVLVVDDDTGVLAATRLALDDLTYRGRPLELISATSAAEAREVVTHTPDIAVILLDVVMEEPDAGLEFARWLRDDHGESLTRIVLRTGHPGTAPPREAITAYDINDYRDKTDLSQDALYVAVIGALRSYEQLSAIERNRQGLERMVSVATAPGSSTTTEHFATGLDKHLKHCVNAYQKHHQYRTDGSGGAITVQHPPDVVDEYPDKLDNILEESTPHPNTTGAQYLASQLAHLPVGDFYDGTKDNPTEALLEGAALSWASPRNWFRTSRGVPAL